MGFLAAAAGFPWARARVPRWIAPCVVLVLIAAPRGATADPTAGDSLSSPSPTVRRWQTQAFREDRLEHMSLALAVGVGIGIAARSPGSGVGAALGAGIAKEFVDVRFDRGDLAADAFGAALAGWIVASLSR